MNSIVQRPLTGMVRLKRFALPAACLVLSGCLPFGNRQEPTELFPADSISRVVASTAPKSSPAPVWSLQGDTFENHYLGTIQFGSSDTLWAADLVSHELLAFGPDGDLLARRPSYTEYPYLVGARTDSLAVFGPGSGTLCLIKSLPRCLELPSVPASDVLSSFAHVNDRWIALKNLSGSGVHELRRWDDAGNESVDQALLHGPRWRYHGPVTNWGESLVSVSSYRPVVDVWRSDGTIDTLALLGFDSPMLARSRSFVLGETDEPPTLIGAAQALEDVFYVVNLRPGVLRIDLFDQTGRLIRTLEREYDEPTTFTPTDLAVQRADTNLVRIAVSSIRARYGPLSLSYDSRLDMYHTQL